MADISTLLDLSLISRCTREKEASEKRSSMMTSGTVRELDALKKLFTGNPFCPS